MAKVIDLRLHGDILEPATTIREYTDRLESLAQMSEPTVFGMRAQLPHQGGADMPLAATDNMTVILKVYASGGENETHAHPYEDHIFLVLQGVAQFFNGKDAIATVHRHQGIMLPHGTYYRFEADAKEPLVMLRVGAIIEKGRSPNDRIGLDGSFFDGCSEENKIGEALYKGDAIFE